jgi:hypothetical protein
MHELVAWLNSNAGAITVLASIVTALATAILMATTIVYAWHTWQLAKENRLLRKAGTDPQVVAYASLNPRVFGAIDYVLANIGKGAAKNITFEILSGGENFGPKNVHLPHRGVKFAFLPQGEQISTFLGMGFDLLAEPKLAPFRVEVRYEDIKGMAYTDQFEIDVIAFQGLIRLGVPADEEIAKSVELIAKTLDRIARGGLQVETITVQEREKLNEARRKQIDEREKRRQSQ